jgi:hypothetical protein
MGSIPPVDHALILHTYGRWVVVGWVRSVVVAILIKRRENKSASMGSSLFVQ